MGNSDDDIINTPFCREALLFPGRDGMCDDNKIR